MEETNKADPVPRTRLLVFGPQFDHVTIGELNHLRHLVSRSKIWALVVDEIPLLFSGCDLLSTEYPQLVDEKVKTQSRRHFERLQSWLRYGITDASSVANNIPASLLTPVVVLTHLLHYEQHIGVEYETFKGRWFASDEDVHAAYLQRHSNDGGRVQVLGSGTGLLSALAVASSRDTPDLWRYGLVALRWAAMIGVLIDTWDEQDRLLGLGSSQSLTTTWFGAEQRTKLDQIIQELHPEVYLSVRQDACRANIVSSARRVPHLVDCLNAAGIHVSRMGPRGRFHNPDCRRHDQLKIAICLIRSVPELQFSNTAHSMVPNVGHPIGISPTLPAEESLYEIAPLIILGHPCDWYETFATVRAARLGHGSLVVSFGQDSCIPPTVASTLGSMLTHYSTTHQVDDPQSDTSLLPTSMNSHPETKGDIAIVGLSIKVAGADDVDEFAQLLRTGSSQHELIGKDRLMMDTLHREESSKSESRKWFGNFIRNVDAFDHRFFKRSPREAASMDPQQRHFLQTAYQAVEQSGYYHELAAAESTTQIKHVGVFLGVCTGDYEHHVACYPPNAYTATGNLMSFVPGKVSHFFGWTGPSLAIDTACSSSAVALHNACRSLLTGECNAALAGGVTTMSNFLWFQNLAGASFLSPTGQCKPFDEDADGYCRAEGIACVFLKRMTDAVADGSQILGRIAGTAVGQNQNCTPLFVPNLPSLSSLFTEVIRKANLTPDKISYVEAHGTGTPVGDPVEYQSVLCALGGPIRSRPLMLGSAKGHVGHTEAASGLVSLVKVVAMMHGNFIPPQASFSKLSHATNAGPDDMIEVNTSLRLWNEERRAALVNNYGASGSNASIIVTQYPESNDVSSASSSHQTIGTLPFWIPGSDREGIVARAIKLNQFLISHPNTSLADFSYNVNRQSNRKLANGLILSCRSTVELRKRFSDIASADSTGSSNEISSIPPERPVVLCFGGQVCTFIGLDQELFANVTVLRYHLRQCDHVIRSYGLSSIFPGIFSHEPIDDPIELQTMLFAMQYACAKCWMDCGLSRKICAVVGHSFGELTALCISGVLSLVDTVKLVLHRARAVQLKWGVDRGAMIAMEASEDIVLEMLKVANQGCDENASAVIACHNGPHSFTLSGSTKAVGAIAELAESSASAVPSKRVRYKELNVSHAFHSTLVEPLRAELEAIGHELVFNEPIIKLEKATRMRPFSKFTIQYVYDHMRQPVFFSHAIQRLACDHPSAIFLEAGSSSTITAIAKRALAGHDRGNDHHFQSLDITHGQGLEKFTDATVCLWQQGLPVTFWPHHILQAYEYKSLLLPPYQFTTSQHWLKLKSPAEASSITVSDTTQSGHAPSKPSVSSSFWTFCGDRSVKKEANSGYRQPRFRVNTECEQYRTLMSGHVIAQTAPICPATLEVSLAIEALYSIHPNWVISDLQPITSDVHNHVPICVDPSRTIWLDYEVLSTDDRLWRWAFRSTNQNSGGDELVHADGHLRICSRVDGLLHAEFARCERQASHSQCNMMLKHGIDSDDPDFQILQGRNLYHTFRDVVDYDEQYRGLRVLVNCRDECVGRVVKEHSGSAWLDVKLSDCFSQSAGISINCMVDHNARDMFIASGFQTWMRSPRLSLKNIAAWPKVWHVLARRTPQPENKYLTDVFIFDPSSEALLEVILGIQYAKIAKASMSKILRRHTTDLSVLQSKDPVRAMLTVPDSEVSNVISPVPAAYVADEVQGQLEPGQEDAAALQFTDSGPGITAHGQRNIEDEVRAVVAEVSGVDAGQILINSDLEDLGYDSLMCMEMLREMRSAFHCELDMNQLMTATTFGQLVACVTNTLTISEPPGARTPSTSDETTSSSSCNDFDRETFPRSNDDECIVTTLQSCTPVRIKDDKPRRANSSDVLSHTPDLRLRCSDILDSFAIIKQRTDIDIQNAHLDDFKSAVLPASTELCTALVVEALERLGCYLRSVPQGHRIQPVNHTSDQPRLLDFVHRFLEHDAKLIITDPSSDLKIRTAREASARPSYAILHDLLDARPAFAVADNLTYYAGTHLADVLSGRADGIRVLFGTVTGYEQLRALYSEHPFNRMSYTQIRDFINLLVEKIQKHNSKTWYGSSTPEKMKILEVGAGTGGTTSALIPWLAELKIPTEYTFTDISSSLVAAARRKYATKYPFMRFASYDIERSPEMAALGGEQHIILASNVVHATRDLRSSLANLHAALRPDGGVLVLVEMTETAPFVDLVFGLLEGWWRFDDGRTHALVPAAHWERELRAVGFSDVDYTDGTLPEASFQRVIIAVRSASESHMLNESEGKDYNGTNVDDDDNRSIEERGVAFSREDDDSGASDVPRIEKHVSQAITGWVRPSPTERVTRHDLVSTANGKAVVVVTGATGSLGSHIVAELAANDHVAMVVCLNRRSRHLSAETRQDNAFADRGIEMTDELHAKLRVMACDLSQAQLGLPDPEFAWLVQHGTHIIHSAWPMSSRRSFGGFTPQLQAFCNLLDLASRMVNNRKLYSARRVGFQLVSSIGVVGRVGEERVMERHVSLAEALPNGYCQAKWACERMLADTLQKFPQYFRAMTIRLGQIAGSKLNGKWNSVEHFPAMVKSAQSLQAWPDLTGTMRWVSVNDVARTMVDLLDLASDGSSECFPVYHIDNPIGQPWETASHVIADAIGIPASQWVSFAEWMTLVRSSSLSVAENPAARLCEFLERHFEHMSCNGLTMDTTRAQQHSPTLAGVECISPALIQRYIKAWEDDNFLARSKILTG